LSTEHQNNDWTPEVSIVIPVLNEERCLARCLQSVVDQDYPPHKLEVIVVDGMSEDRSREIVAQFATEYPHLRLMNNPRRIIPTAMNIGIRKARGEVILRVDGHCFLEPDYTRQCIKHLYETRAANVGGPAWAVGESYIGKAIALALGSPFGHGGSSFRYSQEECSVDTVFLGAFRRELFDQVGFYDETFRCGEDYELNHRIRKAGGKVLLTPKIKVQYLTRNSLRAFCRQYFRYGLWRFQLIRRHPGALRFRHLATGGFVLALIISALVALLKFAPWPACARGGLCSPSWLSAPFLAVISSYLAISVVLSLLIACRSGWRYLPILPVVFACLHLSWGSGFLWALVSAPVAQARVKTALLRGVDRGQG